MKPPLGLTASEAAAWARVAETVEAFAGRTVVRAVDVAVGKTGVVKSAAGVINKPQPQPRLGAIPAKVEVRARPRPIGHGGLDSHWDKRLKAGAIDPDFTLDLHGHTLDAAHQRLERGIGQARAMGARLVLVVTGKPRPVDAADRAEKRGAIRSKILDWLAAGDHADAIAAIRKSHRKHGGDGALYIVLRRG